MGATNQTTNLGLPQFIGTDKPQWIGDFNGAMSIIDAFAGKTEGDIQVAENKADAAATGVTAANTAISALQTTQTTQAGQISTLQGQQQNQAAQIQGINGQFTQLSETVQEIQISSGLEMIVGYTFTFSGGPPTQTPVFAFKSSIKSYQMSSSALFVCPWRTPAIGSGYKATQLVPWPSELYQTLTFPGNPFGLPEENVPSVTSDFLGENVSITVNQYQLATIFRSGAASNVGAGLQTNDSVFLVKINGTLYTVYAIYLTSSYQNVYPFNLFFLYPGAQPQPLTLVTAQNLIPQI